MLYVILVIFSMLMNKPITLSVNQGWMKVNGVKFPVLLRHVFSYEASFPTPASEHH